MKIKNILLLCGTLFFGTMALTSCSDDETYDFDGSHSNLIYLNPTSSKVYNCQVLRTPVGIFGMAGAEIPVNLQHPSSADVKVTVVADTSLVKTYNKDNSTDYLPFPASTIDALNIEQADIVSGELKDTIVVSESEDNLKGFTQSGYVLPLRISYVGSEGGDDSRPISESKDYSVAYIVVTTSDVDDFVSTSDTPTTCSIVNTPVGTFGSISAEFPVSIKCAISSDWTSTLEVENSLVTDYNSENGTSYEALPQNALNALTITPATIKSGETSTETGIKVSLPDDVAKTLTKDYLVPMHLTSTYGSGSSYKEDGDIAYIIIQIKNSLINDDATAIVGKQGDGTEWSAIDCENLDPSGFSSLFTGKSSSRYWVFTDKIESAKFTADLGSEKNLTGFYLLSYVMNNCKVEISTDNSTWAELGSTADHKYVSKYDQSTWTSYKEYVLYAAVKCRYIRYTLNLNTSSWAWIYDDYKSIRNFALYFAD